MENQEEADKLKQQIEEIKTIIAEAKQTISEVKSNANNAKQIIATIDSYNEKLKEVQALIDNPENGINANHSKSKATKEQIDTLKTASDEQLTAIKATLATIQENVRLMNVAYSSFDEINTRIKNPESGLEIVLASSRATKKEIDTLKTASDEQLTAIKATLATIQENVRLMNEAYVAFGEIKEKIDHSENGLIAILTGSETLKQEIVAVKNQSETLFQEIKKFRDESQGYTKEIEEFKKISEDNKNSILGYENVSNDLKVKIEKIYKIATDSGLANSFDQRRQQLQKLTYWWFAALAGSVVALALSLIIIFWQIITHKANVIDGYTWYRLTLTSPLIFFITFASAQYTKERQLLEKYAFKAATALSLEGYTTLLINTFGKEKEQNEREILNFVLTSMTTIYQEPHELVKESKLSFGLDGKIANLKGDFTRKMDETKRAIVNTVKHEIDKNVENDPNKIQ